MTNNISLKRIIGLAVVAVMLLALSACGTRGDIPPSTPAAPESAGPYPGQGYHREGGASWYGAELHGRRTASGEAFDMHDFTAAHRTLPFGSWVLVRNLANGREVAVRINDRGPFHRNRIIDLSRAAAQKIGLTGVGRVSVKAVSGAKALK